ncbi:uncharacterized protein Z518_08158 [Rhinocladiella mackenziei CBS 650.93]|uniref:Uncharacterized protein n=1 Tax=Rhinocladiella mackenziei CBS 650.93 TaxID=1442369 RepID=A0A0D2I8P3_9EURO|nr:uncharacterized protein Z518_08158 [Rhinocladiella mackenziei CBS 650.93]KIX02219.1 hypothetical protein Z518_08158 [Rhinocladiella mackenziei CBS 650.93]
MCFSPPPKKKKKMTDINFVFGPGGTWALWMNARPCAKEPPYYRSSLNLPLDLEQKLYGPQADAVVVHSIALGPHGNFVLAYKPLDRDHEVLWHLNHKLDRGNQNLIVQRHDKKTLRAALGAEEDFFVASKTVDRCHSSTDLIEEYATSLDRDQVKFVAFGVSNCGVVLDKSGSLGEMGDLKTYYGTLLSDLASQRQLNPSNAKVRAVALNPFKADEHFVAFDDGRCCFKCEALGRFDSNNPSTSSGAARACEDIINEWRNYRRRGSPGNDRLVPTRITQPTQTTDNFQVPKVLPNVEDDFKNVRCIGFFP